MVISFEEKNRKRIEATGKNIIQVKQVVYKVQQFFNDIIEEIWSFYNSLSSEQRAAFLKFLLKD